MKVLVIDDDEDIRLIVRRGFARSGTTDVDDAASGAEGVRQARQQPPDVILLDVMMPDIDGVETFRLLRADPSTAGIPVIFLTGASEDAEIDRLKALGAAGILLKPFNPFSLSVDVRVLLNRPGNA